MTNWVSGLCPEIVWILLGQICQLVHRPATGAEPYYLPGSIRNFENLKAVILFAYCLMEAPTTTAC